MKNKQLSELFHHYHHKAFSDPCFNKLEKEISEKFAEALGISPGRIQHQLLSPKKIIEYDFNTQLEYLYHFYNSVYKNYFINNKIETILKKQCVKIGFFDSDLDELSEFLLACSSSNKPFNEVLKTIKS